MFTSKQRSLIRRHREALREYRRAGSGSKLPADLVPLCQELGLLPALAVGTPLCRLAPFCDLNASIRAATIAHGSAGTAALTRSVLPRPHGPRSPADNALDLLEQLEKHGETRGFATLRKVLHAYGGSGAALCTFFFVWVGDDQDALLALRSTCAETAADGIRRTLRFRVRAGCSPRADKLAGLLPRLRASPHRRELWATTQSLLEEHCVGLAADDVANRQFGQTEKPSDRPGVWERSESCLARFAPAEHVAPLMRLLVQLRIEQNCAEAVGSRHLWHRYASVQVKLEMLAPGLRMTLPKGGVALDAFLAESHLLERLQEGSDSARACKRALLLGGVEGEPNLCAVFGELPALTPTPKVMEQMHLLRDVVAARVPHIEALLERGGGVEEKRDAVEELCALFSDQRFTERWTLRGVLLSIAEHAETLARRREMCIGRATDLRRRLVPFFLEAERCLCAGAGDWSFRVAQQRIRPHLMHQPALNRPDASGYTDDDVRPRPPSQLLPVRAKTVEEREAAQKTWTLAALHQPPLWLRVRRGRDAAEAADADKVGKSWAAVFLVPTLDEPAEVAQLGPGQADAVRSLGKSRLFRWRPRADERLLREEMAQMEGVSEAMEPQELYVQHIGVLKKAAVAETMNLHQRGGHIMGSAVQSPLCRDHARPTAALWCSCAVPNQYCGPCILFERWHAPTPYLATQEWRDLFPGSAGHREGRPRTRAGPCTFPRAPAEPRAEGVHQEQELRAAVLATLSAEDPLWQGAPMRLIGANGVWWAWRSNRPQELFRAFEFRLCIRAAREGEISVPRGARLLLPRGTPSQLSDAVEPHQRLHPGFRRCQTPEAPNELIYQPRAPGLASCTRVLLADGFAAPLAQLCIGQSLLGGATVRAIRPADCGEVCWPLGRDGPRVDAALLVSPAPHMVLEPASAWRSERAWATGALPTASEHAATATTSMLHIDLGGDGVSVMHLQGGARIGQQKSWKDVWGRPVHPLLRLEPAPGRTLEDRLRRGQGDYSRCVGTNLSLTPPAPRPRAVARSRTHSEATPLELALLFAQPTTANQDDRAAIHVVGHRVCLLFCPRCKIPAEPTCSRCSAPGEPWHCACNASRRIAVTTSAGTEEWACASCGATSSIATSQTMFQRNSVHHEEIRLPRRHPALHALVSAALRMPRGWARAAHDGCTLHCSSERALMRALGKAKPKPTLSRGGTAWRHAREEDIQGLPLHSLANDPPAAARILGAAAARSAGTLLQNLTNHHRSSATGTHRPAPTLAARTPGAIAKL